MKAYLITISALQRSAEYTVLADSISAATKDGLAQFKRDFVKMESKYAACTAAKELPTVAVFSPSVRKALNIRP